MPAVLRAVAAAAVLATLGTAAPAWACHRGFHSHLGAEAVSISLGGLPLFSLGVAVAHEPCPVTVAAPVMVAPPVVVAPPPIYVAPPVVTAPPVVAAPVYVAAPPLVAVAPTYVPAPAYAPPPPPVVAAPAAPVVTASAERTERDRPNFLALKYLPGLATSIGPGEPFSVGGIGHQASVGAELRFTRWFALRSDAEFRPDGHSYDFLGVKLTMDKDSPLRPYVSASVTGEFPVAKPGNSYLGLVGGVGLDLFLGKYFFLEAEGRLRSVHSCCGVGPQASASVGGGVAFF